MTTPVLTTKYQEIETLSSVRGEVFNNINTTEVVHTSWKVMSTIPVGRSPENIKYIGSGELTKGPTPRVAEQPLNSLTEVPTVSTWANRSLEKYYSTFQDTAVLDGYSSNYVTYNVRALVEILMRELESWENLGTEESILHISNIKDELDNKTRYLVSKDETRIFLSLLQLLFKNNKWEELKSSQVKQFREELKRFNNGIVDFNNLKIFSQQLYRLGIVPINNQK